MTNHPIERAYSLQVAEAALMKELDKLGYQYSFQLAGKHVYTCKCIIKDKKNDTILASGNGKGEKIASRVGSLFEATEHLFSRYNYINPDKITFLNTLDFTIGNTQCYTLPLSILKSTKSTKIPFLEYKAVNGSERSLYPLALSCPSYIDSLLQNSIMRNIDSFNYDRIEQYSSNSGTAIGMNSEEAIIHGLLENIERNSLSEFLTNTFLLNKKKYLRILNPLTLPQNISDVYCRIEKELSSKIIVFEMINKFGVPTYCSWMEQHGFKIGIAGFGCSLSQEHAVLRSLYELAQYFLLGKHIYGYSWMKDLDEDTLTPLKEFPIHQVCAKFDLGSKCSELGYELINYKDIQEPHFSKNPKEYLTQLTDIIYSNGEVPFASELNIIGEGINITHTFITGEDRFFNVRNGKSTFPNNLSKYLCESAN